MRISKKVLDVYIMFHTFDFDFKWLPGGIPESVKEKVDVLMRDDVKNMLLYRKIELDFAAQCNNPVENGDHSCIFGSGQGTFSEEIVRNIKNGIPESGVDSVAEEFIYTARKKISGVNEGDNSCGDDMLGVCQSAAAVKGKNRGARGRSVTFRDQLVVYPIHYEDRKSQWMEMAVDRHRFPRRIKEFEKLFCRWI